MRLLVDIEKKLGSFHLRTKREVESEKLALLGASGCGKSMTLKCIAGIEKPDKGKIILDGVTLFDSEKHIDLPPQKRQVGYLFQQYALFPNMTAEQNIRCALPKKMTREEKKQALSDLVCRFRLEGLEKKLPAQLFGGQQQRVALARILASRPKAILLDEPFSALDSFLKWNLEAELSRVYLKTPNAPGQRVFSRCAAPFFLEIRQYSCGKMSCSAQKLLAAGHIGSFQIHPKLLADFPGPIVWVSHDLGECRRNCERVCVMENGASGKQMGLVDLIRHSDSVSAARLARHKNFLPAVKEEGGCAEIPAWGLTLSKVPLENHEATVCIPQSALDFSGSTYTWRVRRAIADIDHEIVLLAPDNTPQDAPMLRAELPLQNAPKAGDTLSFSVAEDEILVY